MTSLLVLGGTSFVGRHLVQAALDAGHDVTMFNRGRTNPDLFPGVARLVGDRAGGDYAALSDGQWDAVVDVSAYYPRQVREAAAALEGRVGHCTLISTVSVYAPSDEPIDESSPLLPTDGVDTEVVDGDTYGPLKVLCEEAARAAFPSTTVVRPGIVAGPHDPTDRFTYWVRRMTRPGPVLACRPDAPVQAVHARDLADFTLSVTERRVDETFNATGPTPGGVTMAELVAACATAASLDAPDVIWVDEAFVAAHEVPLPMLLSSDAGRDGLFRASCARAGAAGLRNRALVETASDTLAWDRDRGGVPLEGMLDADTEAGLLSTWADGVGGG